MEIQRSTGIVLSAGLIGDADRTSRVFTEEFGKRSFIFKGLRKSRKRAPGVTEPGTLVDLVYYFNEKRELFAVKEFSIIKQHLEIRRELEKIYTLYFLLEITEKTTGFSDPNAQIYNLLVSAIDTLSATEYSMSLALLYAMSLNRIHGILSDFNRCKICCRDSSRHFAIDTTDFRPVCSDCLTGEASKDSLLFEGRYRELLVSGTKFNTIDHAAYRTEVISQILFSLILFVENYFHVEIRSKKLLLS